MVYFKEIRPTIHYLNEHQKEVSWEEVIRIILTTKNPRKKGETFEIETQEHYIVFAVYDGILFVINAKRRR